MSFAQSAAAEHSLQALGAEVWGWRAQRQPRTSDDIPRLDRPPGWVPRWSPEAVADARGALAAFEQRWRELAVDASPVPMQVDHWLVGSVLARARWEMDVVRGWQRDPGFYVDQTLGTVFDVLLQPPPFDDRRVADLLRLAAAIPATLEDARRNVESHAVAEFGRLAVDNLVDVGPQVAAAVAALAEFLPQAAHHDLLRSADAATAALVAYRDWLADHLDTMASGTAVGRDAFRGFLRDVALLPYPPEELLAMGRQEWHRAVAGEAVAQTRPGALRPRPVFASVDEQVAAAAAAEQEVRRFYEERGLLSQPADLRPYRSAALPTYLAPLTWLGVTDDLGTPQRPSDAAVTYIPVPSDDLPYFDLANARDPRAGIVHEGVHSQQLALAFGHEDPLRRRYYDSGPNEGIAFYNEELALQAGLFDDRPDSQVVMWSFMRLRALRVEVDVRLAIGELDVEGAAELLERAVPMDRVTARAEAAFFAASPGQALTYQVGKLQVQRLVSDARRVLGAEFDLRRLHDALWRNGNVPLSLLRWELLGLDDEVAALRRSSGRRGV